MRVAHLNFDLSPRYKRCHRIADLDPEADNLEATLAQLINELGSPPGPIRALAIEEGIPAEESMIRAGERRLRPIMMTALATVAGMIPLALGWGAGSQMLQPLAIAVIGGIIASMVLSLVITPAVNYYIAD